MNAGSPEDESRGKVPAPSSDQQPLAEIRIYRNCELTVTVNEGSSIDSGSVHLLREPPVPDNPPPHIVIGGGRTLPKLLFITNQQRLAANIGKDEAGQILDSLRMAAGGAVIDDLIAPTAAPLAQRVRDLLRINSEIKGVVIIGGYDVVPAQLLDCLPPELRRSLPRDVADADSFRVWSDDVYGDLDGDGVPELPVSRIPDGRSSALVYAALQSTPTDHGDGRFGIRNVERPAADDIYESLPGTSAMLKSEPLDLQKSPLFKVNADNAYIWLHGAFWDASNFWGQDGRTGQLLTAINQSVPSPKCANVVLAAACWGGLTVDTPAGRFQPGTPIAPIVPESSIALSFLSKGSVAFIGCTGSHYSPTGAPLHAAFWLAIKAGSSPAEALLGAKLDFIRGMPHGNQGPALLAVEYKIYTEFTCLGLGW